MAMMRRQGHQVLQDFTRILFTRNPMRLNLESNPSAENEYESEALSILSRYTEGALHLCEDESLRRQIAVGLVRQAFEFWFNESDIDDLEKVAFELLASFMAAQRDPEQTVTKVVPSET